MDAIDISIVIPTLNEERNISETLSGVLNQVRNVELANGRKLSVNLEIIVIDSGSTDRTVEIVREFQRRYSNIKLVTLNFFHHSLTRNLGAKLSGGEIIVFLNADARPANNMWLANLVKPVLSVAEASFSRQVPKDKLFHFEYFRILASYPHESSIIDRKNYASFVMKHGVLFSTVSCAIRRDIFFELGGFDPKVPINEDLEFAIKLLKRNLKIAYVAESTVEHSHFLGRLDVTKRYFKFGLGQSVIRRIHKDFPLKSGIKLLVRILRLLPRQIRSGALKYRRHLLVEFVDLLLLLFMASLAFILGSKLVRTR
ncbi:MAG: glycosyltransferase [Crenarchaeota archaeon]|nr:glycosyltransferase [Thermoproteota archaeon]